MKNILKDMGFPDCYIKEIQDMVNNPDLFFEDQQEFMRNAVRNYVNKLKN